MRPKIEPDREHPYLLLTFAFDYTRDGSQLSKQLRKRLEMFWIIWNLIDP